MSDRVPGLPDSKSVTGRTGISKLSAQDIWGTL